MVSHPSNAEIAILILSISDLVFSLFASLAVGPRSPMNLFITASASFASYSGGSTSCQRLSSKNLARSLSSGMASLTSSGIASLVSAAALGWAGSGWSCGAALGAAALAGFSAAGAGASSRSAARRASLCLVRPSRFLRVLALAFGAAVVFAASLFLSFSSCFKEFAAGGHKAAALARLQPAHQALSGQL